MWRCFTSVFSLPELWEHCLSLTDIAYSTMIFISFLVIPQATHCKHKLGFSSVSFGCDLIFCPGNLIACQFSSLQLSLSFRTPSHLSRFPPASSSRAPTWPSSGQEQIKEASGKLMKRIQEPQGSCQSPASLETVLLVRTLWLLACRETLSSREGFWQRTTSHFIQKATDEKPSGYRIIVLPQRAPQPKANRLRFTESKAPRLLAAVPLREKRCEPRSQTPQTLPGALPRREQNAGEGVLCRVYEIG